ncbi:MULTISPECIES: TetR/AcrR family transcriptional regulator C-terminal domain-containing protein [unclassified Streptomyces]|uniref:TetR/AcrR family transcriptional regulator C-terminal domain-containing protein n=1 Tax=unclassified Streptomyces TaxID=2593676 RepID=UPI002E7A3F6B|nr:MULTISPECIES: TetR/AcrR family transcriptional regulator C-terminal domain-containing protein [unclassified Streptomyces]MEE1759012.1 TetR/AcrR family transcriptional regulator C-terminal domain-containing protein [Streptomyces sp. SP18BB07]MEE1833933.1 TetR/AcrR family transcriptional regulator C-terminal domain-containing protein [Streptomyces sp. SP17KL33]
MVPRKSPKLDKAQVAETALRLLNEVGLEGLSLRLIAKELDVQAPALYWHFKNKQDLLDEMATEMMRRMAADWAGPPPEGDRGAADWQETLRARMRGLREHLLRYRDGAKVYSGTHFTDLSYAAPMEGNLRLLTAAGFTSAGAARAWFTAYSYTIGYVIEEQSMGPDPATGGEGYDLAARAERLAAYPLAVEAGWEMFRDQDRGFEDGLAAVVAGIAVTLRGSGES